MKKEKCKIRENGYLTEKTLTNIKIKYKKMNEKGNDNERTHGASG